MGVMAVGLFITIPLLFHQISSSIQESVQVDPSTARGRNETKDKDVEMSRLTAKMAQIEANLMGKVAKTKRKNDDLEG
ncbi:unnamed protein product, partial [Mesorhabditis belari]|uniref:Uncharacterized protein n=1 Tax=Mesorhabditis belari TaxID=2138241 RepID=A0AAF3EQE8_9BILA